MYSYNKITFRSFRLTLIIIELSTLLLLTPEASASAVHGKPGQKSTTCYFNTGPKVGHIESLKDLNKPVLIGKPCSDQSGNSGIAVEDQEDEEAEAAEEALKEAKAAGIATVGKTNMPTSTYCLYQQGPRSGQTENLKDKILPIPVGSPCSDGVRSVGAAVTAPQTE
jgi:hypothetical protein